MRKCADLTRFQFKSARQVSETRPSALRHLVTFLLLVFSSIVDCEIVSARALSFTAVVCSSFRNIITYLFMPLKLDTVWERRLFSVFDSALFRLAAYQLWTRRMTQWPVRLHERGTIVIKFELCVTGVVDEAWQVCTRPSRAQQRDLHDQVESRRPRIKQSQLQPHVGEVRPAASRHETKCWQQQGFAWPMLFWRPHAGCLVYYTVKWRRLLVARKLFCHLQQLQLRLPQRQGVVNNCSPIYCC